MRRLILLLSLLLALHGCGSYHTAVLYEPSTSARPTTFWKGDGCSGPGFQLGTISPSKKAMVFVAVKDKKVEPEINLRVVIEGESEFKFSSDQIKIISTATATGRDITATMSNFKFSTGGGRYAESEFTPTDFLVGPPRASFIPYYPENVYEVMQWSFSSRATVPIPSREFSVQIPSAVIDGENLSFPVVTFVRREVGYRILCLK